MDSGNTAVDIVDAMVLTRFAEVGAVFLVKGAFLHHEDGAVDVFAQPLLGQHCFFCGVHAADGGAVAVILVARADTLQPGHRLRLLSGQMGG